MTMNPFSSSRGSSRRLLMATALAATCLTTMLSGSTTATTPAADSAVRCAGVNVHSMQPRHLLLQMTVKERRHLPRSMRVC